MSCANPADIFCSFGDFLDMFFAWRLVHLCSTVDCDLGGSIRTMYLNILLDFLVGLIPLIGDLGDAAFKCNTKNVRLLEERLDAVYKPAALKEETHRERERLVASGLEPGNPTPASALEYASDDDDVGGLPLHEPRSNLRGPHPAHVRANNRH